MNLNQQIIILGGGLAGSLLSIYLAREGYRVKVIEKRFRKQKGGEGRSINLALSERGWQALETAHLIEAIKPIVIPMYGRKLHAANEKSSFQPYGEEDQAIYSISRNQLNLILQNTAEADGVEFVFEHSCESINLETGDLQVSDFKGKQKNLQGDVIIGADGIFSVLRNAFRKMQDFRSEEEKLAYGYKEFSIPPTQKKGFALNPNALHIWPRQKYMLIALPNQDKSFTCTLFLPFEGPVSFHSLQMTEVFEAFFEGTFPDAYKLIPSLAVDWDQNPTSSLYTVKCYPWSYHNNLLIGDAAHGIVPFYGQGMNAAFEDCRIFQKMLAENYPDWNSLFQDFQKTRKKDTDAIAHLALENFKEMRDDVSQPKFLLRKEIDRYLHQQYPNEWTPLYTMVTFTNTPYAEALEKGKKQDKILDKIMQIQGIEEKWQQMDYSPYIKEFQQNI